MPSRPSADPEDPAWPWPAGGDNVKAALTFCDSYGMNIFHVIARYASP